MAELKRLASRKAELEGELHTIERQIHELEQNYLEQTNNTGNVVKGWDGYLDLESLAKPAVAGAVAVEPSSRVFSNSSSTAPLQESVDKAMGLGTAAAAGAGAASASGAGAGGSGQ